MTGKSAILFGMISYLLGLGLNFVSGNFVFIYIMALFIYINIFTMFHPVIYHYGVMRPLQLSLSSVGLLSLFTGNYPYFLFSLIAVIILSIIENEDLYTTKTESLTGKQNIGLLIKRIIATILMPFSVTYVVLILRPYEEITSLLILLFYFATLFVSSKWFDSVVSFGIFMLIQIFLFVYIIETYMHWNSLQVTSFFVGILLFLMIGYGRKGLLSYTDNNNNIK